MRLFGDPKGGRKRAALLVALVCATLLLCLTGVAWAEDAAPTSEETVAEAPALDYTFTWPTFMLSFGLVIGYYVFILRMSEKEFKGVVAERFGPTRAEGGTP